MTYVMRVGCAALVMEFATLSAGGFQSSTAAQPNSKRGVELTPAAQLDAANRGFSDANGAAAALLKWATNLREHPNLITDADCRLMPHVLKLFGTLRYTPAIEFLIAELKICKVRVMDPVGTPLGMSRLRPIEEAHPHLAALISIGPPAAAPLVSAYVDAYIEAKGKETIRLALYEFTLRDKALVGAALLAVRKRLGEANVIPGPREEIDALTHLRKRLLDAVE